MLQNQNSLWVNVLPDINWSMDKIQGQMQCNPMQCKNQIFLQVDPVSDRELICFTIH